MDYEKRLGAAEAEARVWYVWCLKNTLPRDTTDARDQAKNDLAAACDELIRIAQETKDAYQGAMYPVGVPRRILSATFKVLGELAVCWREHHPKKAVNLVSYLEEEATKGNRKESSR